MWIRVLTEWPGSPRCGALANVPDALALPRLGAGFAELVSVPAVAIVPPVPAVPVARGVEPETVMVQPGERAIRPKGKARR